MLFDVRNLQYSKNVVSLNLSQVRQILTLKSAAFICFEDSFMK